MKKTVVIGFLGTQLDSGQSAARWEKWRPTLALTQHEDLVIDRLELFHDQRHVALAELVRQDIAQTSPSTEVKLVEMNLANPWDFGEVYAALYDWASAYPFDTANENYQAHITTGTHVAQICLFLLVEARFLPGVLLQSAPPRGRQSQGPGSHEIIDLDLSRYDAINQRMHNAQQDALNFLKSGIATRNAKFNALIEEVERVAGQSKAPMLLTGPTGAGKSMLARRVFELKKARHQLEGGFVEINCATLRGDGAGSTLFGHKKGSFTGAVTDRPGLLRAAHQGLLFLDEIGELGLDEQAMLLKAVEEKRFFPMGSDKEVQSDFQLIAGTNRDLRLEIRAGRFREDLFARINLWTYTLPGLAQRREDIEPNVDHQLRNASQELGKQVRLTEEARTAYLRFATAPEAIWSGNFRDLSASVTRLATLADHGRIGIGLVEAEIQRLRWQWNDLQDAGSGTAGVSDLEALLGDRAAQLDQFDLLQLRSVVAVCRAQSSLSDAGRVLFNVSRTQRSVVNDADRLRKYLLKFGLDWDTVSR
ncbi:transcriptional regulator [Rhodoferax sp. TH121]|uniref:RNA repair transcriptional activator RtcR n=1 Tax=Rhodoferax sp. TH121 TaxID=2022803 RepID=UPI000B96ECAF|nr:RNA repair transcriptional activator RtcR [Rhodoferax sp. TH121]OYQ42338.1 transcriptional regulator [Rhodoferax sp. TH121]